MPQIAQSFTVNFPRERVWQALGNVERVIGCMPGASLTKPPESGKLFGQMKVKLGPITAAFAGEGELSMDEATHTGTIHGEGRDQKNNSRTKADVTFAAVEEGGATRVTLSVDFTLTGTLAQFSRGAIVQEIAQRLTADFARNLEARLAAEAPAAASGPDVPAAGSPPVSASPVEAPSPEPARALNARALLWAVVRDWVKSVLSGVFRRKGSAA
ncbi:SRPBCC family protein [Azospirillum canadense]|uniref:SRPBCC family protein n=1 Tax=Azospirillum canadense TaxID=403962 RepID=UPI002227498E|nr:SRPBCC family protein [Azospirillum canadense]MCW2239385.1 carbon monoxide dehydrogenase subunit G [Azospirillum canadense]